MSRLGEMQREGSELRFLGPHRWPVTLHHGPITLAPIRLRDRSAWERVRRENQLWLKPWEATLPPGQTVGPATYSGMARTLRAQARENRLLPWLVHYDPGTGRELAGQLTVGGIVGGSASWGQIGYWVSQRWAGRGIIPTAVALAVDYCFDVMKLHRIEIAIRPENEPSLRVVAKLGFRAEGLRPRYLHIDGDWRDHLIFAINAEEVPLGMVRRWEGARSG